MDYEMNCLLLDKMYEDVEQMFSKLISWMRQLKKEDLPKKRSMIDYINYIVIDFVYLPNEPEMKNYMMLVTDLNMRRILIDLWVFHTLSKELNTCFTYELNQSNQFLTMNPSEIFYYNGPNNKGTWLKLMH
jgi:hypothetical protein